MTATRLPDCYVRRLALRGPAAGATRSALLVEDALRMASVHTGGAGGARVLVVRSLALGRIAGDVSSATLALRLEHQLRERAVRAVSVRDASAASADAVYFDDPLHALCLLASRMAMHQRADEWFWPLGVPAWRPDMPRADALRAIVMAAFDMGVGLAGPAAVVREVAQHDGLDELLGALRWQDGPELLRRSGWSLPSPALHDRQLSGTRSLTLQPAAQRVVRRWAWQLGASDARVTWLSAMLAISGRPERAADSMLPVRAHALVLELLTGRTARSATVGSSGGRHAPPPAARIARTPRSHAQAARPNPSTKEQPVRSNVDLLPPREEPARDLAEPSIARSSQRRSTEAERKSAMHAEARKGRRHPTQPEPQPDMSDEARAADGDSGREPSQWDQVPTHYAGLFHLLPVLRRLDADSWLQEHPELLDAQFAARLLRHIAQRVGAPADDAVNDALHVDPLDEAGAALLAPQFAGWTATMRRWCHRHAEIGLVALIRRDGNLSWTHTHLDVHFTLRQVDLRVRKAGLDADPGWLPWFGRVVAFHYQPEEQRCG